MSIGSDLDRALERIVMARMAVEKENDSSNIRESKKVEPIYKALKGLFRIVDKDLIKCDGFTLIRNSYGDELSFTIGRDEKYGASVTLHNPAYNRTGNPGDKYYWYDEWDDRRKEFFNELISIYPALILSAAKSEADKEEAAADLAIAYGEVNSLLEVRSQ